MNTDADNGDLIHVGKLSPNIENIDQNLTLPEKKKTSLFKRILFRSKTIRIIPICIKKYPNAYVFMDRDNNCYQIYANDKENKKNSKKVEGYLKKINKSKLIIKYQQPKQDDYTEYLKGINGNCFKIITNFNFKPL
eukprot:TRINITY_DN1729_c0_g1_i1.p1 TRINITY_DN1729_c0_g1~~TRINITY_DN1729_c0_g1_i1.p1  ORF type:complete len:136 (-),score=15.00 TRINITY_DN1729_c0_g1_i1:76-483(-)